VTLQSSIQPGFGDAVAQSQAVFRIAMQAMSRPGQRLSVKPGLISPAPLNAVAAALLLTLCDFETTLWLDPPLADTTSVAEFVRFHTGARLVAVPADATYAIISKPLHMPPLTSFAQGTPEYPDRSATLILQVEAVQGMDWKLEGPGIRGHALFSARPVPVEFAHQLRTNRNSFPCGIDIFFATNVELAALPRSTRLTEIA
jgi:alpha-D-ribose 1-methylphosphonate 5-triphosphate synthase subunit PhnH